MKPSYLTALFLCLFSVYSFAQSPYSARGSVTDTISNTRLINTTVSVLRAKDSTLVKFTRVNEHGTFALDHLPKGKLFLLVTYPGYADYVEQFTIDSLKNKIDFGKIKLTLKATLLANVIIKGTATAIKIKGDTTEFNASSYTIQPNSKVEDLLKQLPGIQIDKDGKITAQGKTVNKVLVDGEEFFGDDPTLVTKNLRGDMVDKVQLYDKKSDQATFTGIDDGQKAKTINIKLKEDKKNGYFGKIDLGGATDKYYEGQAMINVFKSKKKFSAFGNLGNTGKVGLGWQDSNKYGSNDMLEFGEGNSITINSRSQDDLESFNGSYDGNGIPLARTGGVHYDAKWNNDKESMNTNYKIGSLSVTGTNNNENQNNLPTGILKTTSDGNFDNYIFRQKLDGTYQIKLDSSSTLKVSVDGTLKNSESNSSFVGESLRNGILVNKSTRELSNDMHSKAFNARILWTKKFKKKGRTLSLNATEAFNQSDSQGFLNSKNQFFNAAGTLDSSQLVDQYKTNLSKSSVFNANLAYTEALSKTLSIIINYGFGLNNSSINRKSFNQSPDGKYNSLDSVYSNNYELKQLSNQGGVIFNFRKDKSVINLGTKISNVSFDQLNVYIKESFKRNFLNWNPQASYEYRFSQQKALRFEYYGNTSQPSIDQIQPVKVNTDPLNIFLGNPDLKPSFNNRLSLSYNSYKIISGQSIYGGGAYGFSLNPIASNTTTDSVGKNTYQVINLHDKKNSNFYLYFNVNQEIKPLNMNVGMELNANGNSSYSLINNTLNETSSNSYSGQLSISKYKEKKYEMRIQAGPTYTTSQSSLQKQVNNNGWGLNGNASFGLYLPLKFEIFSDANYEYRAKTESFNEDFKRLIWNARISKKFLKTDNLKFSIAANDLLNQNIGFNRYAYGNVISQSSNTTIKRYFMASITWDFNKMGGTTSKK